MANSLPSTIARLNNINAWLETGHLGSYGSETAVLICFAPLWRVWNRNTLYGADWRQTLFDMCLLQSFGPCQLRWRPAPNSLLLGRRSLACNVRPRTR